MALGAVIGRVVLALLLVVLLAGAAQAVAIRARWIEIGPGYDGDGLIFLAVWALLICGILLVPAAVSRYVASCLEGPLLPCVGLAAGGFLLAYLASYDPFYAPELIRYGSRVSSSIPALGVAGAVGAAFLSWKRTRLGLVATGIALFYCGAIAALAAIHLD
jgi:hypothetical protein